MSNAFNFFSQQSTSKLTAPFYPRAHESDSDEDKYESDSDEYFDCSGNGSPEDPFVPIEEDSLPPSSFTDPFVIVSNKPGAPFILEHQNIRIPTPSEHTSVKVHMPSRMS